MSDVELITVEVIQTVHIPDHGVVHAGTEESVPDSPEVATLATAGALKKVQSKPKTGAPASKKETPDG